MKKTSKIYDINALSIIYSQQKLLISNSQANANLNKESRQMEFYEKSRLIAIDEVEEYWEENPWRIGYYSFLDRKIKGNSEIDIETYVK